MKHSSRKAWSTINKLSGKKNSSPNPNTISPNAIASCLLKNGKFQHLNKEFTRKVNRELKTEWNSPSVDQDLCGDFTADELYSAMRTLKAGKAPGPDNLHPEFIMHLGERCLDWLRKLLSNCIHQKKHLRSGSWQRLLLCSNQINRVTLPVAIAQLAFYVSPTNCTNG